MEFEASSLLYIVMAYVNQVKAHVASEGHVVISTVYIRVNRIAGQLEGAIWKYAQGGRISVDFAWTQYSSFPLSKIVLLGKFNKHCM
jgi:hypothetical protein